MNGLDVIDQLHEQDQCRVIDILPCVMKSRDYFELEDYLLKHDLQEYSAKIIRIVLKTVCFYPSQIFLTELPAQYEGCLARYPEGSDLRQLSLEEIAEVIREVIIGAQTSLQILSGDQHRFCIGVNGGFSADVYGLTENDPEYAWIETLVKQEGLFFRKA